MGKKNTQTAPDETPVAKVELKVGDRVNYVLPEKHGGITAISEITAITPEGLHLKTIGKVARGAQHLEAGPVVHYPAVNQVKRKRTNTWHTVAEGEEVAKLEAEAKAKAEAEAAAKAKEGEQTT